MTANQRRSSPSEAIRAVVEARGIAVVGASREPGRIGGRPIAYLQAAGYEGYVAAVNPKGGYIQGLEAVKSLDEADACDVVLLARPLDEAPGVIEDCNRLGIKTIVAFGSSEDDDASRSRIEAALSTSSVRLIGPGTLGIASSPRQVIASFASSFNVPEALPLDPLSAVSLVTQSGAVGAIVIEQLRQAGIPIRHWFSPGEELDVGYSDFVQFLADDEGTRIVGLYLEAMSDARQLSRAIRAARDADKAVVILKVGRSSAGARAVISHTGVITSKHSPDEHYLRAHDAIHVRSLTSFLESVKVLSSTTNVPVSHHIVTISGGLGVMAADVWEERNLALAPVSPQVATRLRDLLPTFASIGNPLDVSGEVVQRPELLGQAVSALGEPTVGVIVLLGLQHHSGMNLAQQLISLRSEDGAPFVSCVWLAPPAESVSALGKAGIPVFGSIETAAETLALLARRSASESNFEDSGSLDADSDDSERPSQSVSSEFEILTENTAKQHLSRAGIAVPSSLVIRSSSDLPAGRLPFQPAVAKLLLAASVHKQKLGLMRMEMRNRHEIEQALQEIDAQAKGLGFEAKGYLLEEQLDIDQEFMVSAVRDERLGTYVLVMRGGVKIESESSSPTYLFPDINTGPSYMLRDDAARHLPSSILEVARNVLEMIAGDIEIQQIELNPVGLLADGSAVAVDAVIARSHAK